MDIEKLKRDAQDQIDRALAEVDRLKGVAKDLEESNKKAAAEYEENSKAIKSYIDELMRDESEAKVLTKKAQSELVDALGKKRLLLAEIDTRREDLGNFNNLIVDKKDELAEIEVTKSRQVIKIEDLIEVKSRELKNLETKIETVILMGDEEQVKLKNTLNMLQTRITECDKTIEIRNEESVRILEVTKKLQSDAAYAEIQKEKAESELKSIELQKAEILKEIDEKTAALIQIKEELNKVKAEIEPLEARRIASITFMEDLRNKESNLKAMYEKVGMEFPA